MQVRPIRSQLLSLPLQKPVSSLPFPIHCRKRLLIIHRIIFESLYKSWASDISPWQYSPLSIYPFIPESLLVTLVFKKLIRRIPDKEGFAVGVSSPPPTANTRGGCLPDPPGFYFTQDLFHTSTACWPQWVPGRLSVSAMFSRVFLCLWQTVLQYLFRLPYCGFIFAGVYAVFYFPLLDVAFWWLPFLFLIAFFTLLLNFSAFKKIL